MKTEKCAFMKQYELLEHQPPHCCWTCDNFDDSREEANYCSVFGMIQNGYENVIENDCINWTNEGVPF